MSAVYQVKGWQEWFEGAKSKDYNNKTTCQMPTKHGLGYKRLIRSKNGPAMFGAWCAMVQVLSRHPKPRQGYLTDSGRIADGPLTPEDLECLTDIPAKLFEEMIAAVSSQRIQWMEVIGSGIPDGQSTDTTVSAQYPLDSDYDSNSDSYSSEPQATPEPVVLTFPVNGTDGDEWGCPASLADELAAAYPGLSVPDQLRKARAWCVTNATKRKTPRGMPKFLNSWMERAQNNGATIKTVTATRGDQI